MTRRKDSWRSLVSGRDQVFYSPHCKAQRCLVCPHSGLPGCDGAGVKPGQATSFWLVKHDVIDSGLEERVGQIDGGSVDVHHGSMGNTSTSACHCKGVATGSTCGFQWKHQEGGRDRPGT